MSGWGIAETAPVIEKIKAESADYLRGLNSCGNITWSVYDKAFDFYMELISRAYEQGKKDVQPEIIHCRECKHHIDGFFCQKANHHTSDTECCASVFGAERREE